MNPWIYSESDYEIYLKSKNITLQEDLRNRNEGFEYIRKMNEALKLPLGTICTGLIYFHRFYMRHSPKKYNYKEICAVCLLTASKLEETPKKMKEFLNVFKQLEAVVDTEHFDLDVTRRHFINLEKILQQALDFDFTVEHPFDIFCELMPRFLKREQVAKAWGLLTDSLRGRAWLLFTSNEIVEAVLVYVSGAQDLTKVEIVLKEIFKSLLEP